LFSSQEKNDQPPPPPSRLRRSAEADLVLPSLDAGYFLISGHFEFASFV
jgi:hypothetical protein